MSWCLKCAGHHLTYGATVRSQDEEQWKWVIAFIRDQDCLSFSFLNFTCHSNSTSLRASIISYPSTLHHTTEALRFPASSFLIHQNPKDIEEKQLFPLIFLLWIKFPIEILGCSAPSRWKVRPWVPGGMMERRKRGRGRKKISDLFLGKADQASWRPLIAHPVIEGPPSSLPFQQTFIHCLPYVRPSATAKENMSFCLWWAYDLIGKLKTWADNFSLTK